MLPRPSRFVARKLSPLTLAGALVGLLGYALPALSSPLVIDPAQMTLVGSAKTLPGIIRLTDATSINQAGAAWLNNPMFVADGFDTSFRFRVTDPNPCDGADGIAFVLHNDSRGQQALGASGAAIGYMGQDGGCVGMVGHSLAIELDLFEPWNRPYHLAIQTASEKGSQAFRGMDVRDPVKDGGWHTIRILYTPGTLKVYLDDTNTPRLCVPLDLRCSLNLPNGQAIVGFTSATGSYRENHDIGDWSFQPANPVPEPAALAVLAIGLLALGHRRR